MKYSYLVFCLVPFLAFGQEEENAAPEIESSVEENVQDASAEEAKETKEAIDEADQEKKDASEEGGVILKKQKNGQRYNRRKDDDPNARIEKIHEFLNDRAKTQTGGNEALEYEFKYFNYGAVTKAQKEARRGKYFVVNWANSGEENDFVLRLEYRQAKTRDKVHVMEIPYEDVKGHQKGTFGVTGKAYQEFGQVLSWKLSLLRDGQLVSERRSFIW